jgi:hypothetical protein
LDLDSGKEHRRFDEEKLYPLTVDLLKQTCFEGGKSSLADSFVCHQVVQCLNVPLFALHHQFNSSTIGYPFSQMSLDSQNEEKVVQTTDRR